MEDYLIYRKKYNLKTEDYNRLRVKYAKLTNIPPDFSFEDYVKHNKDRSYQSNMVIMNSLTKLLKNVESSEDLVKELYEARSSLKEFKSTSTLTKFRKVYDAFVESGKIPKEEDSFRQSTLKDLLIVMKTVIDQQSTIESLSTESTTATHTAKDLWCIYFMGDDNEKEVWETFKWGVSPKSAKFVYSEYFDLVKRYPKA